MAFAEEESLPLYDISASSPLTKADCVDWLAAEGRGIWREILATAIPPGSTTIGLVSAPICRGESPKAMEKRSTKLPYVLQDLSDSLSPM